MAGLGTVVISVLVPRASASATPSLHPTVAKRGAWALWYGASMTQSHPGQELVERYFFEVHQRMEVDLMDELFSEELVLHAPDGGQIRGLAKLEELLRTQLWTLLVPGTVKAKVEFLPLDQADRARHPDDPSALIKFRAQLEATRKEPHPTFGTRFTHEVTNVWRIQSGKCAETWPSFNAEMADRDVIDQVSALGEPS